MRRVEQIPKSRTKALAKIESEQGSAIAEVRADGFMVNRALMEAIKAFGTESVIDDAKSGRKIPASYVAVNVKIIKATGIKSINDPDVTLEQHHTRNSMLAARLAAYKEGKAKGWSREKIKAVAKKREDIASLLHGFGTKQARKNPAYAFVLE